MIIQRAEDVTEAVLAVMERTADPRLQEIMTSLIRHLHGFVREVRLTEAEFREATAILNEMGKLTSDNLKVLLDSKDSKTRELAVRALSGHRGPWPWPWPQPRPRPFP